MAWEKTLLERIDDADAPPRRGEAADPYRVSRSVLDHLERMLNVRQGSVETLPDYGLPDFNDVMARPGAGVGELRKAIKHTVETYEPRLKRVKVRFVPDDTAPLDLRFEITGQVVADGASSPVLFETVFGGSGHARVKG